jgi:parallel beta-helix repeat protein
VQSHFIDSTQDGIHVGVSSIVDECVSRSNEGLGVWLSSDSIIRSSNVYGNNGGVRVGPLSIVESNSFYANQGDAIEANYKAVVRGNNCSDNNGAGVYVPSTITSCRIESNHVSNNQYGIRVLGSKNLIFDNTATSSTVTNFVFAINNWHGGVIDRTLVGSPAVSGNSAASVTATTDPRANFAY